MSRWVKILFLVDGKNNMLPSLPKKHKKDEAKFGFKFRKWVEDNYKSLVSCTFETKDTRGSNSFPFSELTEDQMTRGMQIKSDKGCLIRVEMGTIGAPDYNYYRNAPSFVVIKYPKGWEVIDIETLINESKKSKRRSLLHSRAKEISILSI